MKNSRLFLLVFIFGGQIWRLLFNTKMELRSDTTTRHEEEIDESWSKWARTTLESCGLWCGHVKEGPLMEMVMEEGQTRSLEDGDEAAQENTIKSGIEAAHEEKSKLVKVCEVKELIRNYKQGKDEIFQLVGRLREVWLELMARSETIQERREQDVVFNFLVVKYVSLFNTLVMCMRKGRYQLK